VEANPSGPNFFWRMLRVMGTSLPGTAMVCLYGRWNRSLSGLQATALNIVVRRTRHAGSSIPGNTVQLCNSQYGSIRLSCLPVLPFPGPAPVKAFQFFILLAFAGRGIHLLLLAGLLVCCLA
jgi:hypothetical protein